MRRGLREGGLRDVGGGGGGCGGHGFGGKFTVCSLRFTVGRRFEFRVQSSELRSGEERGYPQMARMGTDAE